MKPDSASPTRTPRRARDSRAILAAQTTREGCNGRDRSRDVSDDRHCYGSIDRLRRGDRAPRTPRARDRDRRLRASGTRMLRRFDTGSSPKSGGDMNHARSQRAALLGTARPLDLASADRACSVCSHRGARGFYDDLVPFDQALEIVTMLARNPATIEPFVEVHTDMTR